MTKMAGYPSMRGLYPSLVISTVARSTKRRQGRENKNCIEENNDETKKEEYDDFSLQYLPLSSFETDKI